MYELTRIAATGSTGNNTHTGQAAFLPGEDAVFQFVVEAVGATPTVTFKWQTSLDNINWVDLPYATDLSDTLSQATQTVTAVGVTRCYGIRPFSYARLVTTLNTNVTYRGELYTIR